MFNLKDTLSEISNLKTEEEIIDFVKNRINILENNSKIVDINNYENENKIYEGYINSNSQVNSSNLVKPFCINDLDLYINFIKDLKEKNITNVISLISLLQDYIIDTFGYKGDMNNRITTYLTYKEQGSVPINRFYQNNSALCSERSASVQNLASLVGLKSYLLFGKLSSENETETHAYNIFQMKNNTLVLFDVTNPVILENGAYVPAINDLGIIDINTLEQVEFDFNYLANLYNKPVHNNEPNRTYYTSNHLTIKK